MQDTFHSLFQQVYSRIQINNLFFFDILIVLKQNNNYVPPHCMGLFILYQCDTNATFHCLSMGNSQGLNRR